MIEVKKRGKIKTVFFNKEPANSLNLEFLKEISDTLLEIEKDNNVCFVVLASKDTASFSSGLDLKELAEVQAKTEKNIIKAVKMVHKIVRLILNSNKIYIASLSGSVIGSAASIVFACDFKISTSQTWFWLPDPLYVGFLSDGGIDIINNTCGLAEAKKFCLINEIINVEYAKSIGLVNEIVENESLEDYINEFCQRLRKNSYYTMQNTKNIINKNINKKFRLSKLLKTVYSKKMKECIRHYALKMDSEEFTD